YYIADMLLFYDARINFKAKYQVTAVMLAITSGYPEIAELLIRKGADLTISDSDGFTPLMLSAKYGYHKLTGLILKRYNQTEDTSRQNHTALSMAVAEGHITTTDTLLRNGANATHFITNNLSPITLTQIHGNDSLKALLKENGAKQNYKPFLDLAFFKYSISANPDDAIFGTHGGVHEIKSNTNISLGFSARYFAKRVMKKQQENLFHQYWERRYVIPLTIDKLFDLSKSYQKQLSLMAGLKTWYTWGRFRGVKDKPKDAFGLSPRAGIYWRSSGAFGVSIHYEYFNLKQQTVSPHRIILSFKLYHALYKKNLEPGKAEELSWY
ncbi:MAG: ankyrin repeat domain-containing protein, partial [Bacteroidales bacterium]